MDIAREAMDKDGRVVGHSVRTVRRQRGTWASTLPMTLPSTAPRGEYHAAVTVEAGGQQDTEATNFLVR